jgi:hypothetical protein
MAGMVARPSMGISKTEHFVGSATVPTKEGRLLRDQISLVALEDFKGLKFRL